ncbi:MAG: 3-hydroxyacyl-CoA dehydrogenase/enoyl-CoA hydratase family protein [Calditrichaeota bacterium]|nr:MAG: 3-hydroxyacyl-CoA dehydrogenase/enoyl-CoA hydratase family protein [Calditrichota bacterium]
MDAYLSKLPFRTAAVLGAGTMGAQIAAHLANAGLQVLLLDIPAKEGSNKNAVVEGAFKKLVKMKPNPFATQAATKRIRLGNFDDDLHRLGEVEWVIEAVVENMEIKRQLMERVEQVISPGTIVSSNTSGLPIHQIAEGRSEAFKKHFLGTHFFNPPRYLKLLEVIPTPDTDPIVVERIRHFGYLHLGKGVVIAKDTPNFIANRIGNFSVMLAMRAFTDGDYTIEEIDALTGPLTGKPKSATFRTADVVGLDTLLYVADNLYAAIPDDESREMHKAPDLLRKMVEKGILGAKTGQGFYKKVGKEILSLNKETLEYESAKPLNLGDLEAIKKAGDLPARLRALYEDQGRAGAFFRQYTLEVLGYCARRIPEIADSPADIDNAMRWGYANELGPFETWDALGFERVLQDMKAAGIALPEWVEQMAAEGHTSFYREHDGEREVYVPGKGYVLHPRPADQISLAVVKANPENTIWERKEAALLDLGEGVALYEFRSKSNALGTDVVQGLMEAIEYVEQHDYLGLVIGNEGKNFSVGANLGEAAIALQEKRFKELEAAVKAFQELNKRIRYARKPVVAAVHGMALGGGCEITMSSAQVVGALETYLGLVELGAGLIPAGCGTTYMTALAAERAPSATHNDILPFLVEVFKTIATARAATSFLEAKELGFAPSRAVTVMNGDRRLYVAKQEVLRLANEGYAPPPVRTHIPVLGQEGRAALDMLAYSMQQAGYATEYDVFLAKKLAYVMCGGNITGMAEVHEEYLFQLEREVFLSLLGERKTQERIHSILTTNKPLRN